MNLSHIILQGSISNSNGYKITSGNKWLNKFENLCMVHKELSQLRMSFVIDWKSGRINRWVHDFELSSIWVLKDVTITYIDKKGHTILQTRPDKFNFYYKISKDGVIKNWRKYKSDFLPEHLKSN